MLMPPDPPASLDELLDSVTAPIYQRLRTAVELGRWENGERLTVAQLEHCLQLTIAYESRHLETTQRTGYIPPAAGKKPCPK